MAELLVQRKKRSALPWIILALIVLAVIGYLVWKNQQVAHQTNGNTTTTTTTTTAPDNGANRNP
jgi:lipopolysaccharide export system protein LptC